jgi:hypothetical protein
MEWKLQLIAFALYLLIVTGGFVLIPKEPPMFGMGMIPGPLALLSGFGLPLIAALAIGIVLCRKTMARKGVNTAIFSLVR